jgi:hypothetical protein
MSITKPSRRAALRVAGVTVVGAAVLVAANGPGVFAGLKATASTVNNPMKASSGTLKLVINSAGVASFSADVADLAPGDSVARTLELDNTGNLGGKALKMKVTPSDATSVLVIGDKALKVTVASCTDATYASCSTSQIAATAVTGLADYVAFTNSPTMVKNDGKAYLKITVALPDTAEESVDGVLPDGTVQGKTVNLSYTFQETQRDAVAS